MIAERLIAGAIFIVILVLFIRWMLGRNAEGTD